MKLRPLAFSAVLWAPLWAACVQPAPARDQLVIGVNQFPGTLHPSIDPMLTKSYVLDMARRPLTTFDHDWKLVCMLCTELPSLEKGTAREVTRPDGTRAVDATFTIRHDATWGDGTPVTTRDVLFTLEVGRHPQSGITNFELFSRDIAGITVVDDKTFTVHWARYLCDYDALNDFRLLPAHLEGPVFESAPAQYGSRTLYDTDPTNPGLYFGPYRIGAVESGSHIVLERNPTWWGGEPAFERVVVRAIENSAALEANLLSGEVDYVAGEAGLNLDQAIAFERRHAGRFDIEYQPGLFYEHLDLNLDDPVLADVRVRRALLHALDREAVSRQLFDGRQPVAHNMVNPLDAEVYHPDYARYPYDPERAAALLEEAGWTPGPDGIRRNADGERLDLTLSTTAGNRMRELIQQVLQSQWRALGIDVRIDNQPARVLFGQTLRERRFDHMVMFSWLSAPRNVPRTTLHSNMIPSAGNGWGGQNHGGYRNPEMDRVLDELEVTCGDDAKPLWAELQKIYAEDLPALPLFYRADAFVMPSWLEGVRPTGHQYTSALWIEE
ncbi:MAG TPA: peptide ABC transporter substrate-binding protein, partial [Arenibaculum sp.]|nr:peptide ABC transporter substrate-binding protein [Arenibaculum sp.]